MLGLHIAGLRLQFVALLLQCIASLGCSLQRSSFSKLPANAFVRSGCRCSTLLYCIVGLGFTSVAYSAREVRL